MQEEQQRDGGICHAAYDSDPRTTRRDERGQPYSRDEQQQIGVNVQAMEETEHGRS
jgi:hypothetical protein